MVSINLKSLVNTLSLPCRKSLENAAGFCVSRSHYNIEIEHWLLKLLDDQSNDIHLILHKFTVDIGALKKELNLELDKVRMGNTRAPALSPDIIDLARNAWLLASIEYQQNHTTSGHILAALLLDEKLRNSTKITSGQLANINAESLRQLLHALPNQSSELDTSSEEKHTSVLDNEKLSNTPALDKYTTDLTAQAKKGKIDPVLGRDDEIRQLIDILIRRRQNNPILTGEAGVGKTAVVEGFAQRIVSEDVPDTLKKVSVRSLDLGLLQAGASVKGEFESRLKSVIAEVKASPVPIIMFIDEAHTMIGAGGKEGQGDAANLLKPALARGELRTIAATTWAEYKKYFERDPALTRRFQVVKVEEPSENKAVDMMRSIAEILQNHHGVRIMDEAIIESVRLSARYITARQLPDKSISLLDTACARVSLSQSATPAIIDDTRRRMTQCETIIHSLEREDATLNNNHERILTLKSEQKELAALLETQQAQWGNEKALVVNIHSKQQAIEDDFLAQRLPPEKREEKDSPKQLNAQALKTIKKELHQLLSELDEIQKKHAMIQVNVNADAIAEVVANWTGIPVGKMVSDEIQAIINLQESLQERVIGQNHALRAVAECIKTSRAGLTDPRKPIGVFFMVGPSGVGKTETAIALADRLYGGEQNLTTINMSEFKEEHKVSMLLGSPPGYVGYGEGGVLTEAVRRKPYSVILLDEMEKAHSGVQDIFYNLFDKGTIKDGEGRDIDFRNTVIIMTSNSGEEHIRAICDAEENYPEPDVLLDNFRPQLLKYFKPAFLGRTTIIPYYPLTDESLFAIAKIAMKRIEKRVKTNYQATFTYDEDVMLHIVARSQEVDTGARNIESILTRTLLPTLATECLNRMSEELVIKQIHVSVGDSGEFQFQLS